MCNLSGVLGGVVAPPAPPPARRTPAARLSYSMGAKYSAVHCMKGSMQQVTEENADRKAAGYRYRHSQWTQLKTSGNSPSPRSGHDVVVIGSKAYLFGGCGGEQVRTEPTNHPLGFISLLQLLSLISNTTTRSLPDFVKAALLCVVTDSGCAIHVFFSQFCLLPRARLRRDKKKRAKSCIQLLPLVLRYVEIVSRARVRVAWADVGRIKTNRNFPPLTSLQPFWSVGKLPIRSKSCVMQWSALVSAVVL